MATRINAGDKRFEADFAALLDAKRETDVDVDGTVSRILADVRKRGNAAVITYTRRFDGFALTA